MYLDTITIIKQSDYSGEASIKLVDDEDKSITLLLNKIIIDLTDGAEPVKIVKYQQSPVLSGSWINAIKETILEYYQKYFKDFDLGVYVINEEGIVKL